MCISKIFLDGRYQQHTRIVVDGVRYIECEFCGKIATTSEFCSYGGINRVNLGICYDCLNDDYAMHFHLSALKREGK